MTGPGGLPAEAPAPLARVQFRPPGFRVRHLEIPFDPRDLLPVQRRRAQGNQDDPTTAHDEVAEMLDEEEDRIVPVSEDQELEPIEEDHAALNIFFEEDFDRLREIHDRGRTQDVVRGRLREPHDAAVLEAELLPGEVRIDAGDAQSGRALADELSVHAEAQLGLGLLNEIAGALQQFQATPHGAGSLSCLWNTF